jgi:diaminopimelate epimerase
MRFSYSKYCSAGNLFFYVDNRNSLFPVYKTCVFCHSCDSEGADGVILLENSHDADFKMRIFNKDGSEAEMCGNGLRGLVKFLKELEIHLPLYRFETKSTEKTGFCQEAWLSDDEVCVNMGIPSCMRWDIQLSLKQETLYGHFIDTGVPHFVTFMQNLDDIDIRALGREVRYHPFFGLAGTNVNFVKAVSPSKLYVRTYERGVEDETGACGTGVVASAIAAHRDLQFSSPIMVQSLSNAFLKISFKKNNDSYLNVFMQGPAKKIAEGFWNWK